MQEQQNRHAGNSASGHTPWPHHVFILLLILLGSLTMLSSSSVVDTARDVYNAWQIASGASYPLEGPYLAWVFHSGPLWFYVMAVPLFFSNSWALLSFWVGILTGLKYLLAYACGSRLGSRELGLIWASLLALPNWTSINYLIFSHTNLIETLMLFGFYSLIRWQQGEARWFVGLCLAVSLAFHAHPTTIALGFAVGPVVLWDLIHRRLSWRMLALGVFTGLLPWFPYLISQHLQQWPDLHRSSHYVGTLTFWQNLLGVCDLARGTLMDAPLIMLRTFFRLKGIWLALASAFLVFLLAGGLVMAGWAAWTRRHWRLPVVLLFMTCISLVIVAMLRNITQYYLVLLIYPSFYGLVAWGWAQASSPWRQRITAVACAAALLSLTAFAAANYTLSSSGHAHTPQRALLDVRTHATNEFTDGIIFPAWARTELASFICQQDEAIVFHGYGSLVLEMSYGLETRMHCQDPQFYLGGSGEQRHLLALSRKDVRELGWRSGMSAGPMHFFEPVQVYGPTELMDVPNGDIYPPRPPLYGEEKSSQIEFAAGPEEWLVITNLYHFWMPGKAVVMLDGVVVTPMRETSVHTFYACEHCTPGVPANWSVTIKAPHPQYVEVVTLIPPPSR